MPDKLPPTKRGLYAWEIQEARRVFGDHLRYEQIHIHENNSWPNLPPRIMATLRRLPTQDIVNAITLGNHLYFPIQLLKEPVPYNHIEFYKLPWLMHELTHAWQYQHMGWSYLAKAINVQIRLGAKAYDFGGLDGLTNSFNQGLHIKDFNLEQQGDIARSYYERLTRNTDVSAWLPFIKEIQEQI
jgi:hypothetical protein